MVIKKKVVIGADHRGFEHKEFIKQHVGVSEYEIEWVDVGTHSEERTDYPEFAQKVGYAVQQGNAENGILLCGTGVGMAIVANRYKTVYAALAWNAEIAKLAKEHDHANVLVLPADYISLQEAVDMSRGFLEAQFFGDRYQQRVTMIDSLGGA